MKKDLINLRIKLPFLSLSTKAENSWYDKYSWITLCSTQKKIFCMYCRFAQKHSLLTFSTKGEDVFSVRGFDNYKKGAEKLCTHDNSGSHLEAKIKWCSLNNPSIKEQLSSQVAKIQCTRRTGLLIQLEAMRYLLRQGLPLRGHSEEEGNLPQLLVTWSRIGDNSALKNWIEEGKFYSHEIVNELITLMGQKVLRGILAKIKSCKPCWYSVIADEATDVACNEQFNLSIRYVDDYGIHEDTVGLFALPNTTAETLSVVFLFVVICLCHAVEDKPMMVLGQCKEGGKVWQLLLGRKYLQLFQFTVWLIHLISVYRMLEDKFKL